MALMVSEAMLSGAHLEKPITADVDAVHAAAVLVLATAHVWPSPHVCPAMVTAGSAHRVMWPGGGILLQLRRLTFDHDVNITTRQMVSNNAFSFAHGTNSLSTSDAFHARRHLELTAGPDRVQRCPANARDEQDGQFGKHEGAGSRIQFQMALVVRVRHILFKAPSHSPCEVVEIAALQGHCCREHNGYDRGKIGIRQLSNAATNVTKDHASTKGFTHSLRWSKLNRSRALTAASNSASFCAVGLLCHLPTAKHSVAAPYVLQTHSITEAAFLLIEA